MGWIFGMVCVICFTAIVIASMISPKDHGPNKSED